MISIYDIAKEAGVSATTVSRVFNNQSASSQTRIKVTEIARNLGYIPDARAAGLKTKSNNSIGVIVPNITNPVYPAFVQAIHDSATERGYYLILGNTYDRIDEELRILQLLVRERVMGIILTPSEREDDTAGYDYLKNIADMGIALVISGRRRDSLKADQVMSDSLSGAYQAVSYLIRIGRKRIAFIAGPRNVLATEQRLAGYQKALAEAGITGNEHLLSFEDYTLQSGERQMEKLLKSGEEIDAVFGGNDLLAIGAMETVKKSGLRIPEDIALVGFDDIELASLVQPKLTTIRQPQEKIGEITCNLLLNRIEGKENGEPKEILFEPELVVRKSA